jgi:predicted AAA+ superfamily ATPase
VAGDYDFPFFKEEKFGKFLQGFMYSFKNIYSSNINGRNILFLTGPSKCGKSWFLRYNIRKFQASSQVRHLVE